MNDTIHILENGGFETESFREANRKIADAVYGVHFLDTPAGRDWDNIVEWKKAQKANKTKK